MRSLAESCVQLLRFIRRSPLDDREPRLTAAELDGKMGSKAFQRVFGLVTPLSGQTPCP